MTFIAEMNLFDPSLSKTTKQSPENKKIAKEDNVGLCSPAVISKTNINFTARGTSNLDGGIVV